MSTALKGDELRVAYDTASDEIVRLEREIKLIQRDRQRPREVGERSSDHVERDRRQKRFEAELETAQEQLAGIKRKIDAREAQVLLPRVENLRKDVQDIIDVDNIDARKEAQLLRELGRLSRKRDNNYEALRFLQEELRPSMRAMDRQTSTLAPSHRRERFRTALSLLYDGEQGTAEFALLGGLFSVFTLSHVPRDEYDHYENERRAFKAVASEFERELSRLKSLLKG